MKSDAPAAIAQRHNRPGQLSRVGVPSVDPTRRRVEAKHVVADTWRERRSYRLERQVRVNDAAKSNRWRISDRRAQHVRIVTSGKRAEAAEPERRDAAASRVAEQSAQPGAHGIARYSQPLKEGRKERRNMRHSLRRRCVKPCEAEFRRERIGGGARRENQSRSIEDYGGAGRRRNERRFRPVLGRSIHPQHQPFPRPFGDRRGERRRRRLVVFEPITKETERGMPVSDNEARQERSPVEFYRPRQAAAKGQNRRLIADRLDAACSNSDSLYDVAFASGCQNRSAAQDDVGRSLQVLEVGRIERRCDRRRDLLGHKARPRVCPAQQVSPGDGLDEAASARSANDAHGSRRSFQRPKNTADRRSRKLCTPSAASSVFSRSA